MEMKLIINKYMIYYELEKDGICLSYLEIDLFWSEKWAVNIDIKLLKCILSITNQDHQSICAE